jgi:hypothetical protein
VNQALTAPTSRRNGATIILNGARRDHVALMPAGMWSADMVAATPGTWLLKCQVGGTGT